MRTRIAVVLVGFVIATAAAACGSGDVGNTSPSEWNDAVDAYVTATCDDLAACTQADPTQCASDARSALGTVKGMLDAAGQTACIDCLDAWAAYNHDLSATCDTSDADKGPVTTACGTSDETCKGYPAP